VLQDDEAALPSEKPDFPDTLDAKVDNFLRIFSLPQFGQVNSAIAVELNTSSSNGFPHS